MIRLTKISDRTYRVTRNTFVVGQVSEPVARRGWVATDVHGTSTYQRIAGGGWHDYSFTAAPRSRATRADAVRRLLTLAGYNADEYAPASAAPRTSRVAAARSAGPVFGIEMELTGPSPAAIIAALRSAGIPMDSRNVARQRELPYGATNTESNVWTLKHDGSVHGFGLELVSPKLSGEAGFTAVRTVTTALNSVGATVDTSTGLHVHHDFRGLDIDVVRRRVTYFVERQAIIARLVAPSRRVNRTYCPTWTAQQLAALQTTTLSNFAWVGPRGNINPQAYAVHGSVEVRLHGGTTNNAKISAWVRFGQALFAAADARADVDSTDAAGMLASLRRFGLTDADVTTLLRFETAATAAAQRVEDNEYAGVAV